MGRKAGLFRTPVRGSKATSSRVTGNIESGGLEPLIGRVIAQKRRELGMRAAEMARALGITASRLARIETGQGRIEASLLYALSGLFAVDIGWFYRQALAAQPPGELTAGPDLGREVQELIKNYWKISDPKLRLKLSLLARSLGQPGLENP
jgi:transcriptional regulator with XRE-family HTH domain